MDTERVNGEALGVECGDPHDPVDLEQSPRIGAIERAVVHPARLDDALLVRQDAAPRAGLARALVAERASEVAAALARGAAADLLLVPLRAPVLHHEFPRRL